MSKLEILQSLNEQEETSGKDSVFTPALTRQGKGFNQVCLKYNCPTK